MALSKATRALLSLLSKPDIQVKKNYKFDRKVINAAHYHRPKHPFETMDVQIPGEGGHIIPLRFFLPDEIDGRYPILLFFHGGGWVLGNIDSYSRTCALMAQLTGHQVISVDYRLAPEYPFPAALEDCYTAARMVLDNAGLFGSAAGDVTLIGDSAGGNLAACVSLLLRDKGHAIPRKQILIYPATYNDHSEQSPFASIAENGKDYILTAKRVCDYLEMYSAGDESHLQSPYFAPLLAEDLSGQPQTLVITAEYDPLRDEGEAYARKLQAHGGDVTLHRIHDAIHGFFTLPARVPAVEESYFYIKRFLYENDQR